MPAKTILVTAGAQGIGRGIAQRFLRGGWRLVLFDLTSAWQKRSRRTQVGRAITRPRSRRQAERES
jgi:NAD(P)-dependent dehydrogenase (short-subunit alcohol dehydrogenase family)